MKFLEAKKQKSPEENKMAPGSRSDQRPPGLASTNVPTKEAIRPEIKSLAEQLGVDLASVTGTGQNGAILVRDVRARRQEMDVAERA